MKKIHSIAGRQFISRKVLQTIKGGKAPDSFFLYYCPGIYHCSYNEAGCNRLCRQFTGQDCYDFSGECP